MSLQLDQVLERIDTIPLAGMNQGPERVAHPSIQGFVKQAICDGEHNSIRYGDPQHNER